MTKIFLACFGRCLRLQLATKLSIWMHLLTASMPLRNQFPQGFLCHVKVNPLQTTSLHKPSCGWRGRGPPRLLTFHGFVSHAAAPSPFLPLEDLSHSFSGAVGFRRSSHSVIGTSRKTRPHSQRRRQKLGPVLSRTCGDTQKGFFLL